MEIAKEQVDNIFKQSKNTEEALIALYKLILPDWEKIKTSKGFPLIGKEGWLYICKCFIRLSKPTDNGFPGLWLNSGFGSSDYLPMWTVDLNHFYPTY
ncbi:hypothetical protein [uncultured Desulfobacter sp.]|uniref:hypothetical protein n=1 Tax=uncultured Desulfobacter sp. TaxID=240139 RepID=UPI002AABD655|nr:hypothetical protein [uncultured Desulfobacter sp.]